MDYGSPKIDPNAVCQSADRSIVAQRTHGARHLMTIDAGRSCMFCVGSRKEQSLLQIEKVSPFIHSFQQSLSLSRAHLLLSGMPATLRDNNESPRRNANIRRIGTGSAELSLLENDPDRSSASSNSSIASSQPVVVRDAGYFVSTIAAGVGSGALSSVICAPLDLVRTRMQVWGDVGRSGAQSMTPTQAIKEILLKEGWRGMFRGVGATLVTVPLFWGVYFPLYDETKHKVRTNYPEIPPALVHMGSAVFTGTVADVMCNPLFVIRTRLQTQALHQLTGHQQLQQSSMKQTAKELFANHGITVFWRGMTANLMGLSHVAIQFPTYEFLKKQARERRNDGQPETALELLGASGTAKMTASLLSYPHEVLRSRMMDSRAAVAPTLTGLMRKILKEEGVGGFYRGLPVTLLRVIPNCCITFLSYEFLMRWSKQKWSDWREEQTLLKQQQRRHA
jgi:solute carrier family 25 folate transporter 32